MNKQESLNKLIRMAFKQICCPQSHTMFQINEEELDKFVIKELYTLKEVEEE